MVVRASISGLCLAATLFLSSSVASAQSNANQDLIDGILQDVIERTLQRANDEVKRQTWIDPLESGYDRENNAGPAPKDSSDETRRELAQLDEEHERKIAKLEEELQRKLGKAEDEFQREAAKEDKADKIEGKRSKLQEKTDKAYAKFEEKITEENKRFDEKRSKILSKS